MSWLYSLVFSSLIFSNVVNDGTHTSHAYVGLPLEVQRGAETRDETEVFEQSYPLNPNGRVSVSNINGSIVVEAWDRNEVKLTATKVADSRETLQEVEIKVDARPDYVAIEAEYPGMKWNNRLDRDRNRRIEVQFRLSVPRTAVLNEIETVNGSVTVSNFVNSTKISAVNGNVNATNLRGAAKLSTVNGDVIADFDRLDSGSVINLSTVNGRVNLTIPSDANATLKADSLNGNISNEFGLPVRKGEYVGRDLYGRLGNGDVQIKLNSVNGALAIGRRNDGKTPNAPTNLLPNRRSAGEWDGDADGALPDSDKIDRDVTRAMREANRAAAIATKEAVKATEKLKDLKLDVDVDLKDVEIKISEGLKEKAVALANMRDAMWMGSSPSIQRKSKTFEVKGTPKVAIEAKNANVRVRGWDRAEVKYVLTELSNRRTIGEATVTEEKTDAGISLKIASNGPGKGWMPGDGSGLRIEVLVPRRSNLRIATEGEIRIEGVSGEVELKGGDGPIDVRGSEGTLDITNSDGIVRVVGYSGDLSAQTSDGEVYLDGDFTKIEGKAVDGKFVLTVPESVDAEITTPSGRTELLEVPGAKRVSESLWTLGKGTRKYRFDSADGSLMIQGRSLIAGR